MHTRTNLGLWESSVNITVFKCLIAKKPAYRILKITVSVIPLISILLRSSFAYFIFNIYVSVIPWLIIWTKNRLLTISKITLFVVHWFIFFKRKAWLPTMQHYRICDTVNWYLFRSSLPTWYPSLPYLWYRGFLFIDEVDSLPMKCWVQESILCFSEWTTRI